MRKRLFFLTALLAAPLILVAAGCRDTGVNPSSGTAESFYAKGGKGGGGGGGGGGKINCKSDKGMEQPMEIQTIDIESAMRVHLLSGGGYDRNFVKPAWYEIMDENGNVTYVPSGLYTGDVQELLNIYVEGFRPNGTYSVRLVSQDYCANPGYSPWQTLAMPGVAGDVAAPVATAPVAKTRAVFIATFRVVEVEATDNTGVSKVEFFFNGQPVHTLDLVDNLQFWLDGEVPLYEWYVPSEMRGQSGLVTVRTHDPAGNVTETSANLYL
ncbi:MAG: hypothetical protein OEN01_11185 [Candidatus Krumholzibacteria bacterium]|nr:hypothetical protein [Candidatus Krumholzibacteria bacterium]